MIKTSPREIDSYSPTGVKPYSISRKKKSLDINRIVNIIQINMCIPTSSYITISLVRRRCSNFASWRILISTRSTLLWILKCLSVEICSNLCQCLSPGYTARFASRVVGRIINILIKHIKKYTVNTMSFNSQGKPRIPTFL